MHRYEVRSAKDATPRDIDPLERAFARMVEGEGGVLSGVEVSIQEGHLIVRMDLGGSLRHAERNGEEAFALAWYDAFGVRGSTHMGRLLDED